MAKKRSKYYGLYNNYIAVCRRKNIFWELSLEEFEALVTSRCIYCNTPPSQKYNTHKYNGIDRKDNSKGYVPKNSVPACKRCNFIKSNVLTFEEMQVAMEAILALQEELARGPQSQSEQDERQ